MNTSNPHQPTRTSLPGKSLLGKSLRLRAIRAATDEAEHVYELERDGESEWTPWIAIAALTMVFAAIGLLMFGIIEVASHLLASAASER